MRLIDSESEPAWRDSLFDLARGLGFDFVLFGVVASKHTDLACASVHSNYLQGWRDYYNAHSLYCVDPTVGHCMQSALPLVWSPQVFEAPAQRELYETACSFGLRSGISLPIHAPTGEVGLISFSTGDLHREEFDRQISRSVADLSLVRDYAFESSRKYRGESEVNETAPELDHRELEVLKFMMAGYSAQEIAAIMHRAELAIKLHISKIQHKLRVKTPQQAVAQAIARRLITPEDPRR